MVRRGMDGRPRLGYLTPMERDEAAATGLALLTPERSRRRSLVARHAAARGLPRQRPRPGPAALRCRPGPDRACRIGCRSGWRTRSSRGSAERVGASSRRVTASRHSQAQDRRRSSPRSAGLPGSPARPSGGSRAASPAATVRDRELWLEGEPLSGRAAKAGIARIFAAAGLEQPRGNIVAPGGGGGVPHSSGTPDRIVRAGETLVVDLFPRAACSPTAPALSASANRRRRRGGARGGPRGPAARARRRAPRRARLGPPGGRLRGVHRQGLPDPALRARDAPGLRPRPGTRRRLRAARVPELQAPRRGGRPARGRRRPDPRARPLRPRTGHGFGIRLEDLVHLGRSEPENLTPLPYDLDPRAWV